MSDPSGRSRPYRAAEREADARNPASDEATVLRAEAVRSETPVAKVLDSKPGGTSESGDVPSRDDEDVVDHRVGWSDLAVAVVPG